MTAHCPCAHLDDPSPSISPSNSSVDHFGHITPKTPTPLPSPPLLALSLSQNLTEEIETRVRAGRCPDERLSDVVKYAQDVESLPPGIPRQQPYPEALTRPNRFSN